MTYAFLGLLVVALTADAKSAPPLIADLVPGHNQTKEFDKKLGSTGIDAGKEFAKPLCVTTREKSDSEVNVELRRIKEEVDFDGKL